MLSFVSLPVELLRSRPRAVLWTAVLAQAALWLVVPAFFYASPPGQVADILAVGHRFPLGGAFGPPLAFWPAEIAFRLLGLFGIYLLSQICVVVTFAAVFALGRAIVGESHAAIAVVLMSAMAVFAMPSPEFGPAVLTMPLWALLLLHAWQAIGQGRSRAWLFMGVEVGLLVLASYTNLFLIALLFGFIVSQPQGRAQFTSVEPFVGGLLAVAVLFPHLIWLDRDGVTPALPSGVVSYATSWGRLMLVAAAAHLGLALLVLLMAGLPGADRRAAPEIARKPVSAEARRFIYFFALAPLSATLLFALTPSRAIAVTVAPLLVLSGLAAVMLLGERIRIVHQWLVGPAWLGVLAVPALIVAVALAVAPALTGASFQVLLPSGEMGRFFAGSFERRTGRPLPIVTGDPQLASLVAMGAPSRPDLYLPATPALAPWATREAVDEKGAVIVWRATGTRGLPPADIAASFPGIVAEVPQAFEQRLQRWGQPARIGWAVIRPRGPAQPPAK
jgi:hypothetical protein